jgi:hypothetical protein
MKANTADHISNDVETPFLAASGQAAPQQHARKKPLTLLPLIALIFFEVSGGPFGTEVSLWGMPPGPAVPSGLMSSHYCYVQIPLSGCGQQCLGAAAAGPVRVQSFPLMQCSFAGRYRSHPLHMLQLFISGGLKTPHRIVSAPVLIFFSS